MDVETGAAVGLTVPDAAAGDTKTMTETLLNSPWQKSPLHSSGDASRLTALFVGYICPICALLTPCQAGASPLSVQRGVSPRAVNRFINLFRSGCTAGLLPRAAGLSAVVLTAVMAAGCGSTPADPVADVVDPVADVADPFPVPLPPAAGVTVSIAEFASLPDLDGQPAQMMHLVDESGTQRLFVNDMRGPLYSISYDGRTVLPYLDLGSPRWALALYIDSTNRGFRSFAFHPQFNTPGSPGYGKFYILADTHNASPSGQGATNSEGLRYSILLEWSAQDPTAVLYDGGPPA